MAEMIEERRTTEKESERHDLFSNLLAASEEEVDVKFKLSDRNVSGTLFFAI